jgi:hypothetical protein
MKHSELSVYLKELEESMYEWDDSPASWLLELEKVQSIIKQLMDDTSKEADKNKRVMFAMPEYKARLIRQSIIRRNQMEN